MTTKTNTEKIRVASRQERMKSRAVGISALLVMLMLTVAITFTALSLSNPGGGGTPGPGPGDGPGGPDDGGVGTGPIVFQMPVNGSFNKLKGFSDTDLQYNATLSQWRSHRAVALGAAAGTEVVATFGGRVQSVQNLLYGTTVIIDHENGLTTTFKSLDRNVNVNPGDRVEKGDKIGTVGTTSTIEFTNTPHVRVEVRQDGVRVDPGEFIDFGEK